MIYRVLRRMAIGSGLMLVGASIAVFFLYRAATAPVPEYESLLEVTRKQLETGELDQSRQELESQLAAVYSDATEEDRWQTILTAQQINGWLATQLDKEIPELAEQGLHDPRIILKPGTTTLAMRAQMHGVDAVVALDLQPFVAEDGSLALELAAARVGSAPLPTAQLLNQLDDSLGEEGLPGRWGQNNGHPVLLLEFDRIASTHRYNRSLDLIEVREGEIYVSGTTTERAPRVAELAN